RAGGPSADGSLDLGSGCGIGTYVGPRGVQIAEINAQAREVLNRERGLPLRDQLLSRPALSGRLGAPVAPLANLSTRNGLVRLALERTLGVHRKAPLPEWQRPTLRGWAPRRRPAPGTRASGCFP